MSEPTSEEIARVEAHQKRLREEQRQKMAAEREAKVAAHVQRITMALIDERVTEVEIEDIDQVGEISPRDGYLKLTFASGRTLKVSVGGWSETYLDVEISEPDCRTRCHTDPASGGVERNGVGLLHPSDRFRG